MRSQLAVVHVQVYMWSVDFVSIDVYVWSGLSVELNGGPSQTFLPVDHAVLRRRPVSDVFQKPANSSTLQPIHHIQPNNGEHIQLFICWMV